MFLFLCYFPFSWVVSPWSECSVTCGSGTQTRRITCKQRLSRTLHLGVSASTCDGSTKPAVSQMCERDLCARWDLSDWGQVSTGVRSILGSGQYWGQVSTGVRSVLGSGQYWGQVSTGVRLVLGSGQYWGQVSTGVRSVLGSGQYYLEVSTWGLKNIGTSQYHTDMGHQHMGTSQHYTNNGTLAHCN